MSHHRIFDFLVIGGQRCGTTWMHYVLAQHPDIFVPGVKEVHFFNHRPNYELGLDWYEQVMAPDKGQRLSGECTPNYFWNNLLPGVERSSNLIIDIAPKVRAVNPEAKLILLLRDPVARAISAWQHHIVMGRLRPKDGFRSAWTRFGIQSIGMYADHLAHWRESFPESNFLILNFERDVLGDRRAAANKVFDFLGVDFPQAIEIDSQRNASGSYLGMQAANFIPAGSFVGKISRKVASSIMPKKLDRRFKPAVTSAEREDLARFYAPFNARLDDMLSEDFTRNWSSCG